jgi:hypothetical protein
VNEKSSWKNKAKVVDTHVGANMSPSASDQDNNHTRVACPCELVEADSPLRSLTNPELELLQEITLREMQSAPPGTALLLLGRVWYRLEAERRRRKLEVQELERIYFAR